MHQSPLKWVQLVQINKDSVQLIVKAYITIHFQRKSNIIEDVETPIIVYIIFRLWFHTCSKMIILRTIFGQWKHFNFTVYDLLTNFLCKKRAIVATLTTAPRPVCVILTPEQVFGDYLFLCRYIMYVYMCRYIFLYLHIISRIVQPFPLIIGRNLTCLFFLSMNIYFLRTHYTVYLHT